MCINSLACYSYMGMQIAREKTLQEVVKTHQLKRTPTKEEVRSWASRVGSLLVRTTTSMQVTRYY